MSSFSPYTQTAKNDKRVVTVPFGVNVDLDNIASFPRVVYDYPINYYVLAIGNGEVGLNRVKNYAVIKTAGKNAVVGDLDTIVYIYNNNFNLNNTQIDYVIENKQYDVIAAYLHTFPTPGDALSTYYKLFPTVKISDEFFDNFNDLFLYLNNYPVTTAEQLGKIARAVIFIRYLYPNLASVILPSALQFPLTYVYYADYLTAYNTITIVSLPPPPTPPPCPPPSPPHSAPPCPPPSPPHSAPPCPPSTPPSPPPSSPPRSPPPSPSPCPPPSTPPSPSSTPPSTPPSSTPPSPPSTPPSSPPSPPSSPPAPSPPSSPPSPPSPSPPSKPPESTPSPIPKSPPSSPPESPPSSPPSSTSSPTPSSPPSPTPKSPPSSPSKAPKSPPSSTSTSTSTSTEG